MVVAKAKATTAIAEDADPQARQVLLRLLDDTLLVLKVGPQVKDLLRPKPGDHVRTEYAEVRLLGIDRIKHSRALQTIANGRKASHRGIPPQLRSVRTTVRCPLSRSPVFWPW